MNRKLLFLYILLYISHQLSFSQCIADFNYNGSKCESDSLFFQFNGNGDSLFWDFDDVVSGSNNYSNDTFVAHVFSNDGNYLVKLIVKDTNGCSDTIIKNIQIFRKPISDFTIDNVCSQLITTFNDLSTKDPNDSIVYWRYRYGDGTTSYSANNSHTYSSSGLYNTSLYIQTFNGCFDSIIKSVDIYDKPIVTISKDSVCPLSDLGIQVNVGSDPVIQYLWDLGDLSSSNVQSFLHQYSQPGIKKIKLKLTYSNLKTCEINDDSVYVLKNPNSKFKIISDFNQCYKQNRTCIKFDLDSTTILYRNVLWDDGSTLTVSANDTVTCHSYANTDGGKYKITNEAVNTNGCASRYTIQDSIIIHKEPSANFTFTSIGGCFTTNVQVVNTSNMTPPLIKKYFWNWGDSSSLDSFNWTNHNHTYIKNGNFKITLKIVDSFNCIDTIISNGNINNTSFIVDAKLDKVYDSCRIGNLFGFKQTPIIGGSARWYFDDTDSTLGWNVTHSYTRGIRIGSYNPWVRVSKNGCDSIVKLDTATVYGPYASTQILNRYQCQIQDTVKFKNITIPYKNYNLQTFWNANDSFAPNCVVDSKNGLNTNSNCNRSIDSVNFQHYYLPGTERCYRVTLTVKDTVLGCTDIDNSPLPMMPPDASTGIDIIANTSLCLGPEQPKLLTLSLNRSTPSCDREMFWVMWDSLCAEQSGNFNANWQVGQYYHNYQYVPCDSNGRVTIGIVIQNGRDTLGNICRDTAFFHHIIKFGVLDPRFYSTYDSTRHYCKNSTFDFYLNDSTLDSVTNVIWNFGDGTIYNDTYLGKRTHTFKNRGFYNITTTLVHANGCSASHTSRIRIGAIPQFSIPKYNICLDDSIPILNNTRYINGQNYWSDVNRELNGKETTKWDIGDGNGFSINTSLHQLKYTKIGIYPLKFEYTDSIGCVDTFNIPTPVRVYDVVSDITLPNKTLTCAQVVNFYSSSSVYDSLNNFGHTDDSIVYFSWFFDNGSSNSLFKNPVKFLKAGWHDVKLIVRNTIGCEDEHIDSVFINGPSADFSMISDTIGCMPLTVTFKNNSINANSYTWLYKNATNNTTLTSSTSDINFTYTNYGTFRPQLIARNTFLNNGINVTCADTFVVNPVTTYSPKIIVYEKPRPNFSHVTNCTNNTTQFTNATALTTGSIQRYIWSFGDGDTSSVTNPIHQYADTGKYRIKLKAYSNLGCVDSIQRDIFISPVPIADFTFNNVCIGNVVNLRDNTNSFNDIITNWTWVLGNGFTSNVKNPNINYTKDSAYTVTLTVRNRALCTNTITKIVNVWSKPKPNFIPVNTCHYSPTLFYNSGTSKQPMANNFWTLGDGTSLYSSYFNKIYNDTGVYSVKLKATNIYGCSDSISKNVVIYPKPNSEFTINNDSQCLNQNQFIFSNTSSISNGSINQSLWQLSNSYSDFTTNLTYKFIQSAQYSVRLITRSNYNCYDTILKNIYVLPSPKSIILLSKQETCVNNSDSIVFNDKSTIDSNIINRKWQIDAGIFNTQKTFKHLYTNANTYPISLSVTTQLGCSDTSTSQVFVYPKPKAAISYFNNKKCLSQNLFYLSDSSSISNSHTLRTFWNFGDGDSSIQKNIYHSYNNSDSFIVRLISLSSKNCSDTLYKQIVVHPMPKAIFTINDTGQCLNLNQFNFTNTSLVAQSSLTSVWNTGDGNSYTSTNLNHVYNSYGVKNVKLVTTSIYQCKDSITKQIEVYPMPKADFVFADSAACFRNNNIRAINMSNIPYGSYALLWKSNVKSQNGLDTFNVQFTQDSSYLIQLTTTSNQGCVDSIAKNAYIWPMPLADFNIDSSNQCLRNNDFKFTNVSKIKGNALTYIWNYGNGVTSYNKDTNIRYTMDGNYNVSLISISNKNCKDTIIKSIVVHPMPKAKAIINDSLQCFNTQNFIFTDLSSISKGSLKRLWKWHDLSSDTSIQEYHFYNSDSTYSQSLISISDKLCADTTLFYVTTYSVPKAKFNINDSDQCLPIQNFVFNNQSNIKSGTMNYEWNFGDGNFNYLVNTTHRYNNSNNYNCELKAISNFGCRDSISKSVIVFHQPDAKLTVNDSDQCLRFNQFKFNDISSISIGSIVNHYWDTSSFVFTGNKDTSITYSNEGTKRLTYVVESDKGCFDTIHQTLTVHPMPKAQFVINDSIQCAQKNQFDFTSISTIAYGSINHYWLINQAINDTGNFISKIFTVADTPRIRLIASSDKLCTDTTYKYIYIQPTPLANYNINDTGQCLSGNSFVFTNSSSVPQSSLSYKWYTGDGNQYFSNNVSHTYNNYGIKSVKLVATSIYQCKDSISKQIEVYPMPKANFVFKDSAACFRNNVITSYNTSNIPYGTYTHQWSSIIKNQNGLDSFKVQFIQDSTNFIKLVATSNYGCKDSVIKNAYIWTMPVADFTIDSSSQCLSGNLFKYSNQSDIKGNNLSYQWNFGNGVISSTKDTSIHYSTDGTYNVSLISISNKNCKDTIIKSIVVHPMPKAKAIINDSLQCFNTQNFIFTDLSSISKGSLKRLWKWHDLSSDTSIQEYHFYNSDSTYSQSLISISDKLCADTTLFYVTTYSVPKAKFNINDSDQCLPIQNFVFNNQSNIKSGTMNYEWNFGDGNFNYLVNTTHRYNNSNNYNCELKAISNFGCRDSISKSVIVFHQPDAKLTVNDSDQCLRFNQFKFNDISSISIGSIVNHYWDTSSFVFTGNKDTSITYSNEGTKRLTYVVESDKGCFDTIHQTLTVHPMPKAQFVINDSIQCAQKNQFDFTSISTIAYGSINHYWLINQAINDTGNFISKIFTVADTPRIRLIASSDKLCTDTTYKYIYIQPTPKAYFSINDSGQCLFTNQFVMNNISSLNEGTMTYSWDFGDTTNSSITNPTHVYNKSGLHEVKLIAYSNHSCSDSLILQINVHPEPKANFEIDDASQCLLSNAFILTNTSNIDSTQLFHLWQMGDGNSIVSKDHLYSYSTDGEFSVKLISYSEFNCKDSIQKNLTVNPMPIAHFNVNDTTQCINNQRFNFTNSSSIKKGNIVENYWSIGSFTSISPSISNFQFLNSGFKKVTIVVKSDSLCSDTFERIVRVYPKPQAAFFINDSVQCLDNNSFEFTSNSSDSFGISSYKWYINNNFDNSNSMFTKSFSNFGINQVSLIVNSLQGCLDTIANQIRVKPMPDASFSKLRPYYCNNDTPFTLIPKVLGGTFTGTNVKINQFHPENLWADTVRYTVTVDGCTSSSSQTTNVYPFPIVNIGSDTTLCKNESIWLRANNWNSTYQWSTGLTDPEILAFKPGIYWVIATNVCGSDTDSIDIQFRDRNCRMYIPTAFSPNRDGYNEVFKPIIFGNVTELNYEIFNRWGEKIFIGDINSPGWDGTYQNELVYESYFLIIVNYSYVNNGKKYNETEREVFYLLK